MQREEWTGEESGQVEGTHLLELAEGWRACQMLRCGETGDNQGKRIVGETRSHSVNEVGALVVLQNLLKGPSTMVVGSGAREEWS